VRITALPFFSSIKGVVQYNMQSGVTDQGQSDEAFQDLDEIDQQDADGPDGGGGGGGGGGSGGLVLTVSVPAPLPRSFGPEPAGVVSRTGSTAESLVVALSGFDTTIITIQPADVVIPAGQASQFFNIQTSNLGGTTTIKATGGGQTAITQAVVQ